MQNHDKTNRKGRKGHNKEIRVSESFCVSPKKFETQGDDENGKTPWW
ncbi:MAG: hypothetical protein RMX97_10230 [Nostoc sp. DedQUE11]|nr:hypothetical protein [Nostoc sp. DedQUE11]